MASSSTHNVPKSKTPSSTCLSNPTISESKQLGCARADIIATEADAKETERLPRAAETVTINSPQTVSQEPYLSSAATSTSTIPASSVAPVQFKKSTTVAAAFTRPTRSSDSKVAITPSDILFPKGHKFPFPGTPPTTPPPIPHDQNVLDAASALASASDCVSFQKSSFTHQSEPLLRTYDPSTDARPISELLSRKRLPRSPCDARVMRENAEIATGKSIPEVSTEEMKKKDEEKRKLQKEQMEIDKKLLRDSSVELGMLNFSKKT